MQKRDSVSVPRDTQKCEQEDGAAVSGSERIAPYRLDQSRVEAYTTGFSQMSIFIPSPFSGCTDGAQWRQGEQVSALFFVAWTQRRLTECFPWATEGPNPSKETLTFKKEIFWQTTSGSLPAGLKGRGLCAIFSTFWCGFYSSAAFIWGRLMCKFQGLQNP